MNIGRRVYLSYCQADVLFALRLATDLKNNGVYVYLDRLDTGLGNDWVLHTRQAFAECDVFIPVLSPTYVTTDYCQQELRLSGRHGYSIFSVLLHPLTEAQWPFHRKNRHYIDFCGGADAVVYQAGLAELLAALRSEAPACLGHCPTLEQHYLTELVAFFHAQDVSVNILAHETPVPDELPSRPQPRQYRPQLERPFTVTNETAAAGGACLWATPAVSLPDLDTVLSQVPRFVLAGLPGSGTTTMLRQVALENTWMCLIAMQAAGQAVPLPIYLRAVDCTASGLVAGLREQWLFDDDPVALLAAGQAVLYLDGLAETAQAADHLAELRAWLEDAQAPQRLIITGPVELAADLGLPAVAAVAPTRQQVEASWDTALGTADANLLRDRLLWDNCRMQSDPPGLQRWLAHPFLLDYWQHSGSDTRLNLGELLRQLVHALAEQQVYADVSLAVLQDGLAALAYALVAEDQPVYVPVAWAIQQLGDERLLEPHNSGAFLQVANGQVRFTHDVLRSYFAARRLAAAGDASALQPPVFTLAEERIPQRWDDAFIILAGLQADAQLYLQAIGAVDPYLALAGAYSGLMLPDEFLAGLVRQVLQSIYVTTGVGRVATACLIPARSPQTGIPVLQDAMRQGDWAARQAATRALAHLDAAPVPGVPRALQDAAESAVADLSAIRQLGTAALPTLLQLAQDPAAELRRAVVLAAGQLSDQAVAPLLVAMLDDEALPVQVEAANVLGQLQDPATVPWLVAAAVDSPHEWTRRAAVNALNEFSADALDGLTTAIQQAPDQETRARMLDALVAIDVPVIQLKLQELAGNAATADGGPNREVNMVREMLRNLGEMKLLGRQNNRRAADSDVKQSSPLPTAGAGGDRPRRRSAAQAHRRLKQLTDEQTPSNNLEEQRAVVLALGIESPAVAVPQLVRALEDDDALIRLAAVQTLVRFQTAESMQALYTALNDHEPLVCDAAGNAFAATGRASIPYLLRALESDNINMRGAAIEALGRIGDPVVVPDLTRCLNDEARPALSDQRNCDLAAVALNVIATPEALRHVLQWQADHTADSRLADSLEKASQNVLNDEHWGEDIPDDDQIVQLVKTLHHKDWHTRQDAAKQLRNYARALHYNNNPAIVRPLEMAARDSDMTVRWAAAEALGWVASVTSVPTLLELLEDKHWVIRVAAVRALLEIHDGQAVPYVAGMLKDEKEQVREAAAEALGGLGDRSGAAIVPLQAALQDEAVFVQLTAITALGNLRDESSIALLTLRLQSGDVNIRWAVVKALAQIGMPECIPALQVALRDTVGPMFEDERICDVAAEALKQLGASVAGV